MTDKEGTTNSKEGTSHAKEGTSHAKEGTKICGICGDKALGYNFNAITCESCKAFFRRNALRNKEFKCPFEGNCKVDLVTRRFCQKCRLKKCFDIGMKKEWILSDEEKQIKRTKIAENRHKRQCVNKISKVADSTTNISPNLLQMVQNRHNNETIIGNVPHPTSLKELNSFSQNIQYNSFRRSENELISSSSEPISVTQNGFHFVPNNISYSFQVPNTSHSICDSIIKNSFSNDYDESMSNSSLSDSRPSSINVQKIDSNSVKIRPTQSSHIMNTSADIRNNNSNTSDDESSKPKHQIIKTENNLKDEESTDNIPDIVYQKTIEVEFANIPIRQTISESNEANNKELSALEKSRLNELSVATTVLKDPLARITSEATGLVDALKMTDQAIRRLIKMSKKINAFKSLCQHDQIALLKAGCTEIIILRSVVSFNFEREYWAIVHDSNNATLVKLDVLKQAKGNIYEAHKKFMLSFRQEWNTDGHILDLLTAIVLFTPNRANTVHKDLIKLEQQTYIYLLQRYLETKHESKCEAKSRYLKLMSKLEELHILNEEHVRIYLDIDPNDVGPLLIEIFDLKH